MPETPSPPEYVSALAALGTVRAYAKNTILIQEGDRSDQIYVVLEGRLKVYLADREGKEIIVDVLGPAEYLSCPLILANLPVPPTSTSAPSVDMVKLPSAFTFTECTPWK